MALLATQTVPYAGVAESLAAAAGGGDTFTPESDMWLEVNNASGGAITVTVVTPGTVRGLAIADLSVSVPAGARRKIRIEPPELFRDPVTGVGNITYSGVTSLTVGAFRLDPTI